MPYPYRTPRRRMLCVAVLPLLGGLAGAAPVESARPSAARKPAAVSAPANGPAVRGDRLILAPGARPFVRGSAPNVWVQDAPPSTPPPARAFRSPRGDGAARGFYSGRMTYLMPNGRCASRPAKPSSWKAPRPAAKAAKPVAGKAPKGGRP